MVDKFIDVYLVDEMVRNARVYLEMGGKYEWNPDLQACDDILAYVLELLAPVHEVPEEDK